MQEVQLRAPRPRGKLFLSMIDIKYFHNEYKTVSFENIELPAKSHEVVVVGSLAINQGGRRLVNRVGRRSCGCSRFGLRGLDVMSDTTDTGLVGSTHER